MNSELERLSVWFRANMLSLNVKKPSTSYSDQQFHILQQKVEL